MDEILRTSPKEFQKISERIIHAFNPKLEKIPTAADLRKRMMKGMRETENWRSSGFLKGGGPEIVVKMAEEGRKPYQVLLGWIKPWARKVIKVKPVVKWRILGYKKLIREFEQRIIYTRHKLRELGYKLRPYSAARIRRLEEEYLKEIGWKEPKKEFWWKK